MRILEGKWGGRSLTSPGGRVRPTAEALRAGMMELIGDALAGARVLDLFAGSGAIGLEALSRGARYCDFVENDPAALHALKANIAALRATSKCRLFKRDAIPFVERLPPDAFDIAFADPPYGSRKLDRVVERWRAVPFSTWLVLEHATDHAVRGRGKTITFDDSAVTVLRTKIRRSEPAQQPAAEEHGSHRDRDEGDE